MRVKKKKKERARVRAHWHTKQHTQTSPWHKTSPDWGGEAEKADEASGNQYSTCTTACIHCLNSKVHLGFYYTQSRQKTVAAVAAQAPLSRATTEWWRINHEAATRVTRFHLDSSSARFAFAHHVLVSRRCDHFGTVDIGGSGFSKSRQASR